jgi:hypothetical protein
MKLANDKIDSAVLALLLLGIHDGAQMERVRLGTER